MESIELRLKASFIALLIVLGFCSCGLAPFVMWLVSIKDYPKRLDRDGVTLKNGQRLSWKALTARKKLVFENKMRQGVVTGVGLTFGKTEVKIAPRVLVDGERVLPFLSRVLGEDLTAP